MLEKEFEYYLQNQDKLVKKYLGKVIVIIGEKVVSSHKDEIDAYNYAIKKYELGSFLIQKVSHGKESYSQTYTSRAIF
jgi:hypothetical protein